MDKLDKMFELRESFMMRLKEANPDGASPGWPIDLLDKGSQQHVRDMALRGVEEMFEALQHLKNWKPHRMTEVSEFNTDLFLEEVVDAFNYFLSVLVLTGFTADDLFQAYEDKDFVIRERIDNGY
tara:strand:+ start:980 stop:1354 length:375 start_codon:yes stop_codon:yes gene_type:complete